MGSAGGGLDGPALAGTGPAGGGDGDGAGRGEVGRSLAGLHRVQQIGAAAPSSAGRVPISEVLTRFAPRDSCVVWTLGQPLLAARVPTLCTATSSYTSACCFGGARSSRGPYTAESFTTFSSFAHQTPLSSLTTVRNLLVVASVRRWFVSQLDVHNAFLNGELNEEVYMQPPPGYSTPDGMARLPDQFLMTDLGSLRYFLGLEVSSTSDGFYISQEKYIRDLLTRHALGDERTVETPMEINIHLRSTDGDPLPDPTRYRHLVGSLVYLAVTRPTSPIRSTF
ncbi:hypothetical protein QYE76_038344 [Lolium multiflorum]|uniref:Reverse transcriptase Ty1/copia-type domain-containing protein n=1 Tax=Lolium multiflorum TaxID=4521 RepID=A0AAD8T7T7_LOLMU|nr:hypothetical protein QYE76_038344 [Lolium multiflorum]